MTQSLMADAVITVALLLALGIALSTTPSGGPGVDETNVTTTGQIDPPPGEPSAPMIGPQGQYVYPDDPSHERECDLDVRSELVGHDLPIRERWWSP